MSDKYFSNDVNDLKFIEKTYLLSMHRQKFKPTSTPFNEILLFSINSLLLLLLYAILFIIIIIYDEVGR